MKIKTADWIIFGINADMIVMEAAQVFHAPMIFGSGHKMHLARKRSTPIIIVVIMVHGLTQSKDRR
jgi:hypothetical protein